jgi:hypothetical protein
VSASAAKPEVYAPGMRPASLLALVPLVSLVACTVVTTPATPPTPDAEVPKTDAESRDATPNDASTNDAAVGTGCDAPITAPPAALGLAPFYTKYLDATGLPVASSGKTSDAALRKACQIATKMLAFRADVRAAMKSKRARLAVMARAEVTTDVPEHADLYQAFPGTDWNVRARGLGGTVARPATSCAEENLLCDTKDPYVGESILVHELAHGIVNLGVTFADTTFQGRLDTAFKNAIAAGKWKDTYAGSNVEEYFAEGVQSYFDTNLQASPPNGIHNDVNTRAELLAYDPALHALVAEVFGPDVWTPKCP